MKYKENTQEAGAEGFSFGPLPEVDRPVLVSIKL